jgi:hypothetical protein
MPRRRAGLTSPRARPILAARIRTHVCMGRSEVPTPWWIRLEVMGATWQVPPPGPAVHLEGGRVVDLTAAAWAGGIRPGMEERRAALLVPALSRQPLSAAAAAAAARRVAEAARRLDGTARPLLPLGAELRFLPVAASALDRPWQDLARGLVPRLGFRVEAAASFAAWASAAVLRAARRGLLAPGQGLWVKAAGGDRGTLWLAPVDDLPVDCLGALPADLRQALRRRGLERVGALRALSAAERQALPGGAALARLLGEGPPRRSAPPARDGRAVSLTAPFEPPIEDRLALAAAAAVLAGRLAGRLGASGLGVAALSLVGEPADGGVPWRAGRRLLAAMAADRLVGLTARLAEALLPDAPVGRLTLAVEAAPLSLRQLPLGRAGPAGAAPGVGAPAAQLDPARLRREERLRLWDPLRAGSGGS